MLPGETTLVQGLQATSSFTNKPYKPESLVLDRGSRRRAEAGQKLQLQKEQHTNLCGKSIYLDSNLSNLSELAGNLIASDPPGHQDIVGFLSWMAFKVKLKTLNSKP